MVESYDGDILRFSISEEYATAMFYYWTRNEMMSFCRLLKTKGKEEKKHLQNHIPQHSSFINLLSSMPKLMITY
jgi:hypothetical protein